METFEDDDEFKTPVVTGAPEEIYLVYGELEYDDTHQECVKWGGVSWCDESVYESDVKYIRADLVEVNIKAAVEAEREACAKIAENDMLDYLADEIRARGNSETNGPV